MRVPASAGAPWRLRRLGLAALLVAFSAAAGAGAAFGFWVASTDSTHPAVGLGDSLPAPARPNLGIDGQDVTISWPATTTVGGRSALAYTVARYPTATGGTAVPAGGGCSASVAGLSCTEATVTPGTWYYAVTARIYNWAGGEGARSAGALVVAPSLSVTAGQVVAALPGTVSGVSLLHFKAHEAVTLHLDSGAGTMLSGTITAVDAAGQSAGFTVGIPLGTADGAHVIVALGGSGSQATSNSFHVDTTAPAVILDSVSQALLGPSDASTNIVWQADESGTYSVRVGATTCGTGTEIAAGGYTAPAQATTTVSAGSLAEGANTVMVCVTDPDSELGWATTTISLDTTTPGGGAVTYSDGYDGSLSVAVTLANGTDAVGGIASSGQVLQRAVAALDNGSCAVPFSGYSSLAFDPPTSPSVYTDATVVTGNCYQYRYIVRDNAGNSATYTTPAVARIDTSAPTFGSPALSLTAGPSSFISGTNAFYNPNTTSGFTVTAPNVTDAQSTISKVNFPAIGSGVSGGGDQAGPTYAATYAAAAGATASGSRSVTATNKALVTATASFTLTSDGGAPVGGALAVNGGGATTAGSSTYSTTGTFSISRLDFTDAGAGLSSSTLTRTTANLVGNTCASFDSPTILTANPAQSLPTGCYRYVLAGTDNVGNTAVLATTVVIDTTAPTTPTLSFSGLSNAYYNTASTTLYFRPAAGGTFTVTAAASDFETAIKAGNAGYTFSSLNTNGGANFSNSQTGGANAYAFNASTTPPTGAATATATNNAGANSAAVSYSVVSDSIAPAAPAPSVTASYYTSASVPVSVGSATDTGSGVGVATIQRDQAVLSGGVCGAFPGSFATSIFLNGGNDTTVSSGSCYQYRLRATDNVGNQAISGVSGIAKVDTSPPSGPTVAFSSMIDVGASGTTVYARSSQNSGSFTITVGSTDPETGASFAFPTFPPGWTAVGTGASRTYSWAGPNPTMPSGNQVVTVTNGAGLVATASFTVVADNTGPSVTNVVMGSGGVTTGKIDHGDTVTVTFSEQMDASKFCPLWSNAGTQSLGDASITVVNHGGHDEISLTSPACPALNVATAAAYLNTDANYVVTNAPVVFGGSVSWNPAARTITITFGGITTGAADLLTGVVPKAAKWGPPAGLTDIAGNSLPTSSFTSATLSGF